MSEKPLRYIINTDLHSEHTGGNEALARFGGAEDERSIRNTPGDLAGQIVKILAHDNVLQRMAPVIGSARSVRKFSLDTRDSQTSFGR